MADFDNGIPPEGVDTSNDRIEGVAYNTGDADTGGESKINGVAFDTGDADTGTDNKVESVAYDTEASSDNQFFMYYL